ncbi:hypothetical protein ADUPG1_006412 [Aduncisulcus paluster]|uniref:Uncharacterized protein n=1 Tax=Aduncisulcus paluster TaxID=2918883 RepID=A0ABQ5KI55_9EUKA|nr:hypothetical protein ADUPG1_006412 [Aduncisulcus paluster]
MTIKESFDLCQDVYRYRISFIWGEEIPSDGFWTDFSMFMSSPKHLVAFNSYVHDMAIMSMYELRQRDMSGERSIGKEQYFCDGYIQKTISTYSEAFNLNIFKSSLFRRINRSIVEMINAPDAEYTVLICFLVFANIPRFQSYFFSTKAGCALPALEELEGIIITDRSNILHPYLHMINDRLYYTLMNYVSLGFMEELHLRGLIAISIKGLVSNNTKSMVHSLDFVYQMLIRYSCALRNNCEVRTMTKWEMFKSILHVDEEKLSNQLSKNGSFLSIPPQVRTELNEKGGKHFDYLLDCNWESFSDNRTHFCPRTWINLLSQGGNEIFMNIVANCIINTAVLGSVDREVAFDIFCLFYALSQSSYCFSPEYIIGSEERSEYCILFSQESYDILNLKYSDMVNQSIIEFPPPIESKVIDIYNCVNRLFDQMNAYHVPISISYIRFVVLFCQKLYTISFLKDRIMSNVHDFDNCSNHSQYSIA